MVERDAGLGERQHAAYVLHRRDHRRTEGARHTVAGVLQGLAQRDDMFIGVVGASRTDRVDQPPQRRGMVAARGVVERTLDHFEQAVRRWR